MRPGIWSATGPYPLRYCMKSTLSKASCSGLGPDAATTPKKGKRKYISLRFYKGTNIVQNAFILFLLFLGFGHKKSLPVKESFSINKNGFGLYHALGQHRIGNFYETSNVCTFNIIYVASCVCTIFHTGSVDGQHDVLKPFVYFFRSPAQTQGIL